MIYFDPFILGNGQDLPGLPDAKPGELYFSSRESVNGQTLYAIAEAQNQPVGAAALHGGDTVGRILENDPDITGLNTFLQTTIEPGTDRLVLQAIEAPLTFITCSLRDLDAPSRTRLVNLPRFIALDWGHDFGLFGTAGNLGWFKRNWDDVRVGPVEFRRRQTFFSQGINVDAQCAGSSVFYFYSVVNEDTGEKVYQHDFSRPWPATINAHLENYVAPDIRWVGISTDTQIVRIEIRIPLFVQYDGEAGLFFFGEFDIPFSDISPNEPGDTLEFPNNELNLTPGYLGSQWRVLKRQGIVTDNPFVNAAVGGTIKMTHVRTFTPFVTFNPERISDGGDGTAFPLLKSVSAFLALDGFENNPEYEFAL